MKYPRLFVGPMSKEIVDVVLEYSQKKNTLGLIPSRRQVEHSGGYVNNWSTNQFAQYVRHRSDSVCLVRDHGGPSQGNTKDDGLESFSQDINCNFDILHIDPWKECSTIDEGVEKTLSLIQYCESKRHNINFEVGTEESIFPYSALDLDKFLGRLRSSLGDKFDLIKFAVIQSGVQISGTENTGKFDPRRLEKMVKVVKNHGLLSKEHNGDYLSSSKIQTRAALGLDSINIAPEFGVAQTKILLNRGLISIKDAVKTCKEVDKFSKWIPKNLRDDPPDQLVVEVSGHYCFTKDPFAKNISMILDELKNQLFDRFDEIHEAWK